METILGSKSLALDLTGLAERLTNYHRIMLDLGTGDGRYVQYLADNFRGRYETFLTDPKIEPRRSKWQIEVAIKLMDK